MKRFKSARHAQRLLAAHDQASNLFHLRRDHDPAAQCRAARAQAFRTWAEVTGVAAAAYATVCPARTVGLIAGIPQQLDGARPTL